MAVGADIAKLRELGWSWTRIGSHYRTSEREVRRWAFGEEKPPKLPPPLQLNFGTALIVNDTQFPYHDPAIWDVTCEIAEHAEVDTIIYDGDMLDFEQLGSYKHDRYRLQPAEHDVDRFIKELRDPLESAVKRTLLRRRWANGNHEDRYERYKFTNDQPTGTSLFPSMRDFLKLEPDVDYAPWGAASGHYLTPKLLVAHGWYARRHSAYTAKAHAEEIGSISVITGHTHRVGLYMHDTVDGPQAAYEVGHMCDPDRVPKAKAGWQNWQAVAGTLVHYERGGDAFKAEILQVIGRKGGRRRVLCDFTGAEYKVG